MSDKEDIVLSLGSVRVKKQDGNLLLTNTRIAWSPEGSANLVSNTPYNEIKSHRLSKEGSSKVQLQLILQDTSTINFHFTSTDAVQDRQTVSDLLRKLMAKSVPPQLSNEMEAKRALLQNKDIYRLYKDMVVSGLITAEEFWANRQNQLDSSIASQASGVPSAFLIDVEAVTTCNAVKYNITKNDVANIFRTYPTVEKRHSELVPDKMSDEEFWVQFFQSQKFHRNRLSHKENRSGLFEECLSIDLTKDHVKEPGPSLSLPAPDNPLEDPNSEDTSSSVSSNKHLIQRCNMHSTLVLNAIHSEISSSSKFETSSLDGSSSSTNGGASLNLSVDSPHVIANTPPEALYLLANDISQSTPTNQLSNPYFHSTMRHLLPEGSLISNDNSTTTTTLSPSSTELLYRYQSSLSELLRHFWACFPVINQQLEQKVQRMAQCLQDFREKQLIEFTSQVDSSEQHCVKPLLTSINTALVKYHDWLAKRQQK